MGLKDFTAEELLVVLLEEEVAGELTLEHGFDEEHPDFFNSNHSFPNSGVVLNDEIEQPSVMFRLLWKGDHSFGGAPPLCEHLSPHLGPDLLIATISQVPAAVGEHLNTLRAPVGYLPVLSGHAIDEAIVIVRVVPLLRESLVRNQAPGVLDQFVADPVEKLFDAYVEDAEEHISIELPAVAILESLRQSEKLLEVLG